MKVSKPEERGGAVLDWSLVPGCGEASTRWAGRHPRASVSRRALPAGAAPGAPPRATRCAGTADRRHLEPVLRSGCPAGGHHLDAVPDAQHRHQGPSEHPGRCEYSPRRGQGRRSRGAHQSSCRPRIAEESEVTAIVAGEDHRASSWRPSPGHRPRRRRRLTSAGSWSGSPTAFHDRPSSRKPRPEISTRRSRLSSRKRSPIATCWTRSSAGTES